MTAALSVQPVPCVEVVASFGRVNSHYVRVNLTHPVASQMAMLQDPEIIVHNEADDGTQR